MFNRLLISTALIAGMATAANAATVSYSQTLLDETTDFSARAVGGIQQFNSSLGTLNSATITLMGTVSGEMGYENRSTSASNIDLSLSAEVALSTNSIANLIVALPTINQARRAGARDGVIDFAGAAGGMIVDLASTNTVTAILTGTSLSDFIGNGLVGLTMSGDARSNITGSGSLTSFFDTFAGGTVMVTYDYTGAPPQPAPVPLPAGMPLLALGLGALAIAKKSRKS